MDVEQAWAAAVEKIVEAQPDLVTVAGDVVHHPRVGVHAIKAWRDGIRRIVRETGAHVVVVQGNHDAGRTAETLSPIVVPGDYERVHLALEPKRLLIELPRTGQLVSVACAPFVALGYGEKVYEIAPDPAADVNVLVIHAAVNTSAEGAERLPSFYADGRTLDIGQLAGDFDVIAAGDYHDFHRLHPTALAFYSGSIERTSSNIWPEVDPKGVVLVDELGTLDFLEIPTRPMLDRRLSATFFDPAGPYTAADVNETLEAIRDDDETFDAIVRLVVDNFPREERESIDQALLREIKGRALHFQLDLRFAARSAVTSVDRREAGPRSLMDAAADFFESDPREVCDCALAFLGGDECL
jgi:hypothetical protein